MTLACSTQLCAASNGPDAHQKDYVYVWYPRSTDVPSSDTAPETIVLKAVLKLVTVDTYVIQKDDTLNYILRQKYFISENRPKAFSLYVARIIELNPTLGDPNKLTPGSVIKLPRGPKFGASEIGLRGIATPAAKQLFLSLSAEAYFSAENHNKVKTDALGEKVGQNLGYLFQRTQKGDRLPLEELLSQVEARGIVPAVDVGTHPDTDLAQAQTYHLTSSGSGGDAASVDAIIANEKNGHLLPSSISEVQNVNANCNSQCATCASVLKVPASLDWSKARVLVTDTGVDMTDLQSSKANLVGVGSGQDISDVSSERHGTFVFSEIAKSGQGPIPDQYLYVAKVASPAAGGANFDIASVLNAWASFNATELASGASAPRTWIANISAEGGSAPGTVPEPVVPFSANLLIIAAAGNGASGDITSNDIFPRLSNPNSNLIVVGSLAQDGTRAAYSNWHRTNVQLFTRGDCICGIPGQLNGTSQATPLVTVAAAALASTRPDWYASQVMWRLFATSDRTSAVADLSFAGIVNLPRALGPALTVRSDTSQGGTAEDAGSKVIFDQEWTSKIADSATNLAPSYILLRLTDRRQVGGSVCFTSIRYLLFSANQVCVSPTAQITLAGVTGTKSFAADHLEDIFLPMNGDRIDALPVVTSTRN